MKKNSKHLSFKILVICLATVFIICMPFIAYAHSGGTDSNGGHYNHTTGEYHYHHGYPAHQHINDECPYDFVDNTNHSPDSPSSSKITTAIGNTSGVKENDSSIELTDKILSILLGLLYGCFILIPIIGATAKDSKPKNKKTQAHPAARVNGEKNKAPEISIVTTTTLLNARVNSCPKCGRPLIMRNGPYGKFYGCTSYPYCRYTESIKRIKQDGTN